MTYLLDTNVISELRKGPRCNANVAAWFASVDGSALYLSLIVLGELRRGIEMVRVPEPDRARIFERWLSRVRAEYRGHILGIDERTADEWGRMTAIQSHEPIDVLLAATAKVNGMTLVTRNVAHVSGLGVDIFNPFDDPPKP